MANASFGVNIIPKNNTVSIGNSNSPWNIVSPNLTGTPVAPTAATGTNTTQVATTAFVANSINGKINSSEKGAANGVAELDGNGKVPSSQLPSYVDDVEEYSSMSAFPATGENGKIYIALDTNKTYRWGGSEYVSIASDLALGETSSTAYRGDRGKTAYDHATDASKLSTAQNSGLYKFATTSEGHIASVTAVAKADITALGIPGQDTTYSDMTGAGASEAGTHGLVPAPSAGDNLKFLRGDGVWADAGGGIGEYATDIPMSSSDSTTVYNAIGAKADKITTATSGNFASFDGNGNIQDSGKKASDFVMDVSGKADKVSSATNGNFAGLDSNGNLTDSGSKASDFLTSHQDISGKADKVSSATNGNFAGLDGNGNLTDSGKKASDFMEEMTILSYGNSTWNDFITAYSKNRVIYCRASSNSNPATGTQSRLAFMAYVNDASSPTSVEFQYYRSVSSHSATQQGDQVFVYQLTSSGAWTVTTREATSKIVAGTNMSSSYSNGVLTLSATDTTYSDMTGATSSSAGSHGLVPAPSSGDDGKFLRGDGTWAEVSGGGTAISDISFSFATTDWTSITGGYKAEVTNSVFVSNSKEIVNYTESMENLTSGITVTKDSTNNKMVFTTSALPSGTIAGNILSFGDGNIYTVPLPSVSSVDNGKVLRVVNGEWAVASLPSANGVSV